MAKHFVAAAWTPRDGLHRTRRTQGLNDVSDVRDRVLKSVVSTGPGVVAVGRHGLDAAVWTSHDGTAWTLHDEPVFGGPRAQELDAVVAGGPGFVAVGTDRASGRTEGAAWWSRDGATWHRAPGAGLAQATPETITGLAKVPGGFVAVGYDGTRGSKVAAAWSSGDGRHWHKLSSRNFGLSSDQELDTVIYAPSVGVVGVGDSASSSGDLDAAVWFGKLRR